MLLSLDRARRLWILAFVTFIFLLSLLYAGSWVHISRSRKFDPPDLRIPILPLALDTVRTGESWELLNTTVSAHVPGFTVFENVYLRNGTIFVVYPGSPSLGVPERYPSVKDMISKAVDMAADADTDPGDRELTFVSSSDVSRVLGPSVRQIHGTSVMVYDTTQFLNHYYHWWGEVMLGAWKVYSATNTSRIPYRPTRFLIPFSENGAWRDRPGINAALMRVAFPNITIEESDWWSNLQQLNTTVVFNTFVLVNRNAAHRHQNSNRWHKMIGGTMDINISKQFWDPIKDSVAEGILGYIPHINRRGAVVGSEKRDWDNFVPLITYVSRQGTHRRLTQQDHEGLVATLESLDKEGVIRFFEARMEKLSIPEQIELAARTTVMIGVHGNGLTHQLWMPRSSWSTVMEIFRPNAYIFDYELLSRNIGHRHYAVWNDTFVTYPEGSYHENFSSPEDFHGNDIPVFGPAVAAKIKKILAEGH